VWSIFGFVGGVGVERAADHFEDGSHHRGGQRPSFSPEQAILGERVATVSGFLAVGSFRPGLQAHGRLKLPMDRGYQNRPEEVEASAIHR